MPDVPHGKVASGQVQLRDTDIDALKQKKPSEEGEGKTLANAILSTYRECHP